MVQARKLALLPGAAAADVAAVAPEGARVLEVGVAAGMLA
jgi:hypothetical protein